MISRTVLRMVVEPDAATYPTKGPSRPSPDDRSAFRHDESGIRTSRAEIRPPGTSGSWDDLAFSVAVFP
jgi:hypothetical protein